MDIFACAVCLLLLLAPDQEGRTAQQWRLSHYRQRWHDHLDDTPDDAADWHPKFWRRGGEVSRPTGNQSSGAAQAQLAGRLAPQVLAPQRCG